MNEQKSVLFRWLCDVDELCHFHVRRKDVLVPCSHRLTLPVAQHSSPGRAVSEVLETSAAQGSAGRGGEEPLQFPEELFGR